MTNRIKNHATAAALCLALVWLAPASPLAAEGEARDGRAEATRPLDPDVARSLPTVAMASNACNPCAAKNPCNPCGGGNPCNPCGAKANPCAGNPCNPCGGGNPCNPCGGGGRVDPARFVLPAGASLPDGSSSELVARGEALWQDGSLSTNGASCSTCHVQNYAQMQPTFADPYPHRVAMVEQMSGVPRVSAAEMVQFCMLQPMQAEPLAWGSPELAALAAYVEHIQPGYQPMAGGAANPCNPCAPRNACNPCNPCGAKSTPCGR